MKSLTTLVAKEVQPLTSGEVLHAPVEKMSVGDRLTAYVIAQWMLEKIGERREELNLRLKEDVGQVGVANDKGHKRFEYEGSTAVVEKREGKMPDEKEFKKLLAKNGIDEMEAFDEVKSLQMNPSKIDKLIATGKLKQADVDALKKTTYALKVEPSHATAMLLEETAKAFEEAKAAVTGDPPKLPEPKKSKGKSASP
jgi:hypothetical protein